MASSPVTAPPTPDDDVADGGGDSSPSPPQSPPPPSPPDASTPSPPPPPVHSPPPPPSDDSTPSPPPPVSSPPPPPSDDSTLSPPPPVSSPPPPPSDHSTPSPPPPPPVPSPPPPSSDDSTPSPPPPVSSPPPPSSDDNSPSPPPPSSSQKSPPSGDTSFSPPPPPKSKSRNSPGSNNGTLMPPGPKQGGKSGQSDGNSGNSNDNIFGLSQSVIIGVGTVIVLLVVLLLISAVVSCCHKKKKKKHHGYFSDPHRGKDYYNNNMANPQGWQPQGGAGHNIKIGLPPGILPPPGGGGGGWQPQAPPPLHSTDMSSGSYSGPYGPPLPPPSPHIALGFNKSTFSYEELAAATSGFSQSNMIGQGGFGYVYRGVLPNGKEVAVKQLKAGSGQGEKEFHAEVEIISRVHHRHLVSLVGYCITGAQRLLVYEFVPNNTLEHHLHGKGLPPMDWPTRLRIAIGSAKGLAYLHEDCHPRIIHRDIKTANILLDYKFEAMVADFGLAKSNTDANTHVSTRVMGTFGYLAPEYASTGKLTDKSDVFSYGVMLLELISGRRPIDHTMMEDTLVDWARPILGQVLAEEKYEVVADPKLEGKYNPTEMASMIACAAASVRHSAKRRPKMSQILRALEGDMISYDDLSEGGVKPGQSAMFNSPGSDYEPAGTYSSKMRQLRQAALGETSEYTNNYTTTSDYGLNPSESSNSSGDITYGGGRNPRQHP